MKNKKIGNIFKGDKVIWMIFFFLCIISIVEFYSASSSLSYTGGNYWSPLIKHTSILLLGIGMTIAVMTIQCKYFKLATPFLLLISFILLCWVLFAGDKTNDAARWIGLFGLQFQPSELAKGALILAVAQILSAMQTDNGADRKAFSYILVVSAFIILPIALENLSTAALLIGVCILMMFIGRVPMRQLGRLLGTIALLIVFALVMIMALGKEESVKDDKQTLTEQTVTEKKEEKGLVASIFHRANLWKTRINKFLSHEYVAPEKFDLDENGQVGHANIAIATSNVVGKGPGNSNERDWLSQAFSDFIYAIIIEEMGIEGAIVVALLYIFLLFRTGQIANRCENNFPAFLAMGLALLMVSQALFNMLVAVGLAPVTGQPLPLISKGGTSTIINCIYIGVILSISRSAKKREPKTQNVADVAYAVA